MKSLIPLFLLLLITPALRAQNFALPPFLKWENNNSPGCKNVFVTKDSMLMAVKNPCVSEGVRANWRPSVNISQGTPFTIPAGGKVELMVTYRFSPQGGDVLGFYGTIDPADPNADVPFTRSLELTGGLKSLPPAGQFTTVTIPINFSDNTDTPVLSSPAALKGFMNLNFNVTTNGGETHKGSYAVIKEIHVEVK